VYRGSRLTRATNPGSATVRCRIAVHNTWICETLESTLYKESARLVEIPSVSGYVASQEIIDPLLFRGNAIVINSFGISTCGLIGIPGDTRVVEVSKAFFESYQTDGDSEPYQNPLCGRLITVECNAKTISAEIIGMCGSCTGLFDLSLSPGAFKDLIGTTNLGAVQVNWLLSPE